MAKRKRLIEIIRETKEEEEKAEPRYGNLIPYLSQVGKRRKSGKSHPPDGLFKHSEGRTHVTRIGQNIDRLRKKCGWSFEKLADKTGLDKKTVLSHVNKGAKPRPDTLKLYADEFTSALGKQVTVQDLEQ